MRGGAYVKNKRVGVEYNGWWSLRSLAWRAQEFIRSCSDAIRRDKFQFRNLNCASSKLMQRLLGSQKDGTKL